jgi:hypothetical protein
MRCSLVRGKSESVCLLRFTDQDRARSDFASATQNFFANLRQAGVLARRRQRKPNADQSATSPEAVAIDILQAFHHWFINDFVDPALISACRIPVYRPLFALKLLEMYVGVFGDDALVRDQVFTERMVKLLIGCQASEFTEVRGRARTMYARVFISPLWGR